MRLLFVIVVLAFGNFRLLGQSQDKEGTYGKVVLDNETVRVTEFGAQPGKDVCGLGKHSHGPHLTVILKDATITVTGEDGKVMTMKAAAGTTFWVEAETHMVVNSGRGESRTQIIEYKKKR